MSFPTSPTDGQVYQGKYYDNTVGAWRTIAINGDTYPTLNADYSTADWDTINLPFTLDNPGLVGMLTFNGSNPATCQIINFGNSSFQAKVREDDFYIQEVEGSGAHDTEEYPYIVFGKKQITTLPSSPVEGEKFNEYYYDSIISAWREIKIQAHATQSTIDAAEDAGGYTFTFEEAFDSLYSIVIRENTYNGTDTANTRLNSYSTSQFHYTLQETSNWSAGHSAEEYSYIAVGEINSNFPSSPADGQHSHGFVYDSTIGAWRKYKVDFGRTNNLGDTGTAEEGWTTTNFHNTMPTTKPILLQTIVTTRGGDNVVVRMQNRNNTSFQSILQEDDNGTHDLEDITWVALYI